MPAPDPTLTERAAGALLGLAAAETRGTSPAGELPPETGLAALQAEALLQQPLELERLVGRWIDWARSGGAGLDAWTRKALEHIALHQSPPAALAGPAGSAALARTVPVALAARATPANLLSGSFHLAWLLHPDPRCAWGAVAVNVAIARFLAGRRDFLPDVIEALRNNDAPAELLEAVRRVPLRRREEMAGPAEHQEPVVRSVELTLWLAWHEPRWERGMEWLSQTQPDAARHAPIAGAVLGARDGERAIPPACVNGIPKLADLRRLAHRLVGVIESEQPGRLSP